MRKEEIFFMSRLVAAVPVKRVQPVDDIASVSRLCKIIIDDFHGQIGHRRTGRQATGRIEPGRSE